VRLEGGFFEYGTFGLDLERAADLYPQETGPAMARALLLPDEERCEAERFFASFDLPELAEDLFNLFEQARLMRHMARRYPGLVKQALPELHDEIETLSAAGQWDHFLAPLYSRLVTGHPSCGDNDSIFEREALRILDSMDLSNGPVEACVRMVCSLYPMAAAGMPSDRPYRRLVTPFGRRLRWDLVRAGLSRHAGAASRIKIRLAAHGLKVYRSDLQQKLNQRDGRLSGEDIEALVLTADRQPPPAGAVQVRLAGIDLSALFQSAGIDAGSAGQSDGAAFYYPEWDEQLRDYLRDHVRVQESVPSAGRDGDFYREALDRHRGMVARIRRAFEFLKPEGLVMLRQWPEGDDFDYRALIDFALDMRSGRIPSDRLYVKRLKQQRDVAALLLVDMSRSTANPVIGGRETVLTVAKEALVLFCEALQVVGDAYAVAGFSGTGRHSVDYYRIKDFEEPLGDIVRQRISSLRPQRSTRMGAAIRHAAMRLSAAPARVRLLIVVSDGFPNDLGYKADYAIADTRRAVQEACSHTIHVKAITVNIGSDPRLDDLYGRVNHHVIGDVRDLPDKLLRLYGTLTKRY
jgi:nitric oxide reductase NorD protein